MLKHKGIFISVDGPNAVGKGTYIDALYHALASKHTTYVTKEPTATKLGRFAKTNEGGLSGLPYAFLIAADRCLHIETEILPRLENGEIIISDRYVESSFVLQKFDGVSYEAIWALNSKFIIPNLSILLLADQNIISQRLSQRTELSAFEKRMTRQDELVYYSDAKEFLIAKGYNYLVQQNNTTSDLETNVHEAILKIQRLLL